MKPHWHKYIFFLIVLFYCVGYAPFGFDDTDGGYLTAYAWRVLNGELPYVDFIKTKPPLSPYVHAFFMYLLPDRIEYLAVRMLMYVFCALYSFLSAKVICENFQRIKDAAGTWLLSSLSFVFSIHNFPPMPWYTIDGILFASIGIYLITRKSSHLAALSSIFFVLSALTKQSFYLLPVFGFLFLLLKKDYRTLVYYSVYGGSMVLLYFLLMNYYGAWKNFLFWTNGINRFEFFLKSGLLKYYPGILSILLMTLLWWMRDKIKSKWIALIPLIFICCVLVWRIYSQLKNPDQFQFPFYYGQVLFIASLAWCLYQFFVHQQKQYLIIILMLSLSWSASISFGYLTPVLFFAPLLFFIIDTAVSSSIFKKSFFYILLLLALFTFAVNYYFPYREQRRSLLTQNLGSVYPKLSFIYSGADTYERLNELKLISGKYGNNFKTLPSENLSNYITNSSSPLQADWIFNLDINFKNDSFVRRLNEMKPLIILEKKYITERILCDTNSFSFCGVGRYVYDHWIMTEETKYYQVYKCPAQK